MPRQFITGYALIIGWFGLLGLWSISLSYGQSMAAPGWSVRAVHGSPLQIAGSQSQDQRATNYSQVLARLDRLTNQYPAARWIELGTNGQGRALPLLILADPPLSTPAEAAAQVRKGKMVMLLAGNLRGNAPEGTAASLRLAADLLAKPQQPLLKEIVLLIAPVVKAEGLEAEPVNGFNSQGGTATRGDFIKLETGEVRALVRALNQWDPAIVIETGVSQATSNRFDIISGGPGLRASEPELLRYVREVFLPEVNEQYHSQTGRSSFSHGSPNASERSTPRSNPAMTRLGASYVGLRGRIGLFADSAASSPFSERIKSLKEYLQVCLEYAAAHKEAIRKVLLAATKEEQSETTPPFAYLFPSNQLQIVAVLLRHGLEVEELREEIELNAEQSIITTVTRAKRGNPARHLTTVKVEPRRIAQRFDAGTVLVRTRQKLGRLAAYLLEPQSRDGLVAWNFFDDALKVGTEFPVLRLPKPTAITRTRVRPLAEERIFHKPITFEAAFEQEPPINLAGAPVGGLQWLEDGKYFLQTKDGQLRKVHAATGRSSVFLTNSVIAQALTNIPALDEKTSKSLADRAASHLSPDRSAAWFNHDNDLYYARVDGSEAERLTHTPQTEELVRFSPNGEWISFVRSNNLYVVDLPTLTERALTLDGAEHVLNGKHDWVYFEELYNRDERAYWWSPDSRRLAFFRTDNAMVPPFTLVNDLPARQVVERTPYPRPGEPNPRVQLGIVTVAGSTPAVADLSDYDTEGHLISGVGWWPDGSALYCLVQDRTQTWLDFCSVPVTGGKPTRLFRDQTKAWIEAPAEPKFLKDGSFLVTSERTGWQHLYHYERGGRLKTTLTAGAWEVRKVVLLDEARNWVYFTATKDSPIAENLYRARLDGSGLERLTREPGHHQINMSPTGNAFIDTWSSHTTPTKVVLRRADGSRWRWLDSNPVYAVEEYCLGLREQFQIKTADGFLLEAAWVKPPDFDARKKYPVWFTTYAGPHAPSISDNWQGGALWDRALAQAGIVVFRMDPRPASGKGAVSAWTAYHQLGVQELKDITEAIGWLKEHPWVDGSRIGMSGYSYGGFMTAYAMTHSQLFAAGIAGGSPTDWRDYDTIYTERYMSTPQQNPEGYSRTSVVKAAADLHGRLLLVHGAIDDNVHPANTLKLARALQDARKQFELMLYPGMRHGVYGRQYQRMQYEFILRTVGERLSSE